MDDKNQIWEIMPQPHLNENILKEGNFQILKSLEEIKIYGQNNEKDNDEKNSEFGDDIEICLNDSFYNVNKKDEKENSDEYYKGSDNDNISEDSQGSNIANAGKLRYKKY